MVLGIYKTLTINVFRKAKSLFYKEIMSNRLSKNGRYDTYISIWSTGVYGIIINRFLYLTFNYCVINFMRETNYNVFLSMQHLAFNSIVSYMHHQYLPNKDLLKLLYLLVEQHFYFVAEDYIPFLSKIHENSLFHLKTFLEQIICNRLSIYNY